MSAVESHARLEQDRPSLLYDARADEMVGAQRVARAGALDTSERRAVAIMGTAFLLVAVGLLLTVPVQRDPGLPIIALYVGAFAVVSRVEFEIFTDLFVPTQLVFIPLLFVLPLRIVPLAVVLGLLVGSSVHWARGQIVGERVLLSLSSAWYTVGPVLVLWAYGERVLSWSDWPVVAAAVAAQFAVEVVLVAVHEAIAGRTRVRTILSHLVRAQVVDVALASGGLAIAFAAVGNSLAVLLALPLAGLLNVFARERSVRIDGALELSAAYRGTAFLLGDVIDGDDAYTGMHSRHVVELATAVADELGLSDVERRDVEFVALLHDVGKIRLPAEVISKPGPLSPEEWVLVKLHTIEGEAMLAQVGGLLGRIGHIVRSCHERWDGDGYPDGLVAEEIPLAARIVTCCDALSAMTTDRAYRRALTLDAAVAELRANAGTQFDPTVAEALIHAIERGTALPTRPDSAPETVDSPAQTDTAPRISAAGSDHAPSRGRRLRSVPGGRQRRESAAGAINLLPIVIPVVLVGTVATALAAGSLATRTLSFGGVVGALVLLAAAAAAEAYPVPIEGVSAGGVSLAASFLVSTALIYDWHTAVLVSLAARLLIELAQRRPLVKVAYNSAVFALSGAAAGGVTLLTGSRASIPGLLLAVAVAAFAFYSVNVSLVAAVVARATHTSFVDVVRQSARWTAVPFVIMASLSLMLDVLWQRSPILAAALAGPLVAVGLYQRSVHGALVAMRLAKTDPLTGLGNHRAFHESLESLVQRDRGGFALCLIDADGFKQINDRHGHQAGDDVLVLLAGQIRDGGQAFRLGGDEFAIMLPDTTAEDARHIAKTVIARIGRQRHPWGGFVTVSAGIALFPTHAEAPDRLFGAADTALYQAKRRGRNQVHVFDPSVAVLPEVRRSGVEAHQLDAAWGLAELIDTADGLREDDDYAGGHSLRVSDLAARLAARCRLEPVEIELVRLAARLHDLGKLAVPVEILQKPGSLEQREWRVLEEHPEIGQRILSSIGAGGIAHWVLHHHERWDGTGKPSGMRGTEIPLAARIIFVAEAYDAITSERPYRSARSQAEAIAELRRCAGTQFDPSVVTALTAELADERDDERLTG